MWPPTIHQRKGPSVGVVFSALLATLSAVLSVGTAYFTIYRRIDNLSLVVPGPPAIEVQDNKFKLGNPKISIINNGDRPAVVHLIWILLDQQSAFVSYQHCKAKDPEIAADIRQFLVKEKSVVPRDVIGSTISPDKPIPKIEATISKENLAKRKFPLEVCIDIQFSTPSKAFIMTRISLVRDKLFSIDTGFSEASTSANDASTPFLLYYRNGNIFQD
jgi:hypothetical protein